MKLKNFLSVCCLSLTLASYAVPVKVTMNSVSTTMTLSSKDTDRPVDVGNPSSAHVYEFQADPGEYILTAFANSKTKNGTIVLNVRDNGQPQEFAVLTCTAYVTNTGNNGAWSVQKGDYELDITVNSKEGERQTVTYGESTTSGRNTFLAFNGNSYNVAFIPNEEHRDEGFMTLYKGGTLTGNLNISGKIPTGAELEVSVPADATIEIGQKFTHFTDFKIIQPQSSTIKGNTKTLIYRLAVAQDQSYNFRTWKDGGITYGGYFFMNENPDLCPEFNFTDDDYAAYDPKKVNHDVNSNGGYETGDIFLNINERGHLNLAKGDVFNIHAMRTWEITDNSTNNYFIEPDFHYTVLDLNGNPSESVVQIDNSNPALAWAELRAVGKGTAIVLVTYDAICLNYYKSGNKNAYMGGEYWSAIWPENTGVFVVTVDDSSAAIDPRMVINEKYNSESTKIAGRFVDAEHDVFYYLDTEPGALYTFTPAGATGVALAYPVFNGNDMTYNGFTSEGVTDNGDGSFTLLLKHGRQIVKLSDASGKSVYQVLTAKSCHREIINASREGSRIFQPGDKIKIQYSGLFHPANKIAGIYNMSAYITYNDIPNGSSLILGAGQYTFGSAPSAQAVTIDVPSDYDVTAAPEIVLDEGVIQVNGYGDPVGNHRNTSRSTGRSPNFTAVAHKTYFGALPEVRIPIRPVRNFHIKLDGVPVGAAVELVFNGEALTPDSHGHYDGTYGTYNLTVKAGGYLAYRNTYEIPDKATGYITFRVEMEESDTAWDGMTKEEPALDENGTYIIEKPSELAWFAENVNDKAASQNAIMTSDIHLGFYDWTPVGKSSSAPFTGVFDARGHTVEGLYINTAANYQGLFGYAKDAVITGLTVKGAVSGQQYVGGIAGYAAGTTSIDRCANYADVTGTKTYIGGVVGSLSAADTRLTNTYNAGRITGSTNNCGGVAGYNHASAVINNVFSVGEVSATTAGACIGGTTAKTNMTNAFSIYEYKITENHEFVTEEQMASGEIACLLGDAFGQTIGKDRFPVLGGKPVLYDEENDTYYNQKDDDDKGDEDSVGGIFAPDAVPEIYYNLQGIGATTPWTGINIVRMSDGSIRKTNQQ